MALRDIVTWIKIKYDGKSAERGLKRLHSTSTAIFGAIGARMVMNYTAELSKLGMEAETVAKNFENFARMRGRDTQQMMTQLRSATLGMVEDMKVQQTAMRAMIAGVSFDDLIVAMEYVTKYAIATGSDVNQRMSTVMTGLARGSALMLDDVGIMVAKSENTVRDAIDQMRQKMDQFTISTDDASVKAKQMNAELENQKRILGKDLAPIYLMTLELINRMVTGFSNIRKVVDWGIKSIGNWIGGGKQLDVVTEDLISTYKNMADKQEALIWLEAERVTLLNKATIVQDKMNKLIKNEGDIVKTENAYKKLNREYQNLIYNADKYAAAMKKLNVGPKKIMPGAVTTPTNSTSSENTNLQKMLLEDELKMRTKAAEEYKKLEQYKIDESTWLNKQKAKRNIEIENEYLAIQDDLLKDSYAGQHKLLEEEYVRRQLVYQNFNKDTKEIDEWFLKAKKELRKKEQDEEENAEREKLQNRIQAFNSALGSAQTFTNAMMSLSNTYTQRELKNLSIEHEEKVSALRQEYEAKKLDAKKYNRNKIAIDKEYNDQKMALDIEYDANKADIEAEAFERNKKWARMQQAIVLARAISDVAAAGIGALKDSWGGVILKSISMAATLAAGAAQIAVIQAQNFQSGFLGEVNRLRRPDDINARIGRNEAVIPAMQYAMHEEDVRAIVTNTANTASGLQRLKGGQVVNNFYGLSDRQVTNIIKDQERRNYTGNLL